MAKNDEKNVPDLPEAPDPDDQSVENTPNPEEGDDEMTEKPDRGPIDPITNQPLSDFLPQFADDKHADRVAVMNDAVAARRGTAARSQMVQDSIDAAERNEQKKKDAESLMDETEKQTKAMFKDINFIPPDVYLARENARVKAEAATLQTSTIRPGGEFIVNGVRVNANGEAL